jgi:predicted nucleic acid-binding protein
VSYLIDTNVISEVRKRERCHPNVARWFGTLGDDEIFFSALTIGELRRGIDSIHRRDTDAAAALNRWLNGLAERFEERILPVDVSVAEEWGRLNVPDPLPVIDGLLAATAKLHRLTVATRNTKHIARAGVGCINPFDVVRE